MQLPSRISTNSPVIIQNHNPSQWNPKSMSKSSSTKRNRQNQWLIELLKPIYSRKYSSVFSICSFDSSVISFWTCSASAKSQCWYPENWTLQSALNRYRGSFSKIRDINSTSASVSTMGSGMSLGYDCWRRWLDMEDKSMIIGGIGDGGFSNEKFGNDKFISDGLPLDKHKLFDSLDIYFS